MEIKVGNGKWIPPMHTCLRLTEVCGGAGEVDRVVTGGDKAGEVEELV